MTLQISEYSHVFRTWEVYPRVQYFQKRFRDVFKRFTNITNKLPHMQLFRNEDLYNNLRDLCTDLEGSLKVLVIGKDDLNMNDFIITDEPLKRSSNSSKLSETESQNAGMTIVLCYIKLQNPDSKGIQDTMETVSHLMSSYSNLVGNLFLVCDIKAPTSKEDMNKFRDIILVNVKKTYDIDLPPGKIIIGPSCGMLSNTISIFIESKIVSSFRKMEDHLDQFVKDRTRSSSKDIEILDHKHYVRAVKGFLTNGWRLIDILKSHRDEEFIEIVLDCLVHVIRCAILSPLSLKYNVSQNVCNLLANEWSLEDEIKRSISKNTRYHLSKIEDSCTQAADKPYTFPRKQFSFIAYPLKEDIKKQTSLFEEELATFQRGTAVMRKMLFEISGYMKQSVVKGIDIQRERYQPTTISDKLRRKLLTMKGVFGVGTIYGELEIHIKTTERNIKDVRNDIADCFRKMKIYRPYRLREVVEEPVKLDTWQCETGGTLESISPYTGVMRKGTLGGFASNNDNQLFGLTCAHVVQGDAPEHDVFIRDESSQQHIFGKSTPQMTIRFGTAKHSFIDFAAVKVLDDVQQKCMHLLKDDDGVLRKSLLSTASPDDLIGSYLYKYGAKTGFTEGIVSSVDYSMFGSPDAKNYLVIIDTCPDSDHEMYADRGDSGSINCMVNFEENEKTIETVSMISAGQFRLEEFDSSVCLSFLLRTAFAALRQSGVDLTLPTGYN